MLLNHVSSQRAGGINTRKPRGVDEDGDGDGGASEEGDGDGDGNGDGRRRKWRHPNKSETANYPVDLEITKRCYESQTSRSIAWIGESEDDLSKPKSPKSS